MRNGHSAAAVSDREPASLAVCEAFAGMEAAPWTSLSEPLRPSPPLPLNVGKTEHGRVVTSWPLDQARDESHKALGAVREVRALAKSAGLLTFTVVRKGSIVTAINPLHGRIAASTSLALESLPPYFLLPLHLVTQKHHREVRASPSAAAADHRWSGNTNKVHLCFTDYKR